MGDPPYPYSQGGQDLPWLSSGRMDSTLENGRWPILPELPKGLILQGAAVATAAGMSRIEQECGGL